LYPGGKEEPLMSKATVLISILPVAEVAVTVGPV
jgi:hypothetical protein